MFIVPQKENGLISVIIPVYNSEKYILETLISIEGQTFKNYEVIIVDDGSTDNSYNIVKNNITKMFPNAYLLNQENQGATRARINGVQRSHGQYLLFLDSDDYIQPTFMEKTFDLMEGVENTNLGFAYVDTVYFSEDNYTKRFIQPEYNFIRLIEGNYISYCSLFRKKAYLDCGGHDYFNRNFAEDYQLYLRLGRKGWYGKHIPEPLFYYRDHSEGISKQNKEKMEASKAYFIKQMPEIFPVHWHVMAEEILKEWPENFMSVK